MATTATDQGYTITLNFLAVGHGGATGFVFPVNLGMFNVGSVERVNAVLAAMHKALEEV